MTFPETCDSKVGHNKRRSMAFEIKETFKNFCRYAAQYIVVVSGYLKLKETPGRDREGSGAGYRVGQVSF